MEPWIALVAAVVGGTGIAGAITEGIQMTQSARIRRNIEHLAEARKHVGEYPAPSEFVDQALQIEAVRMAALTKFREGRPWFWYIVSLVLTLAGALLIVIGLVGRQHDVYLTESQLSFLLPVGAGYVITIVGLSSMIRWWRDVRRDRKTRTELERLGLSSPPLSRRESSRRGS